VRAPLKQPIDGKDITLGDEHMIAKEVDSLPAFGEEIDFIPGQSRTTSNLHNRVWVERGGLIVDCRPIYARGRSQ
jgi:D-serine deaminase-like pyridoxal phosphate-dependent protein